MAVLSYHSVYGSRTHEFTCVPPLLGLDLLETQCGYRLREVWLLIYRVGLHSLPEGGKGVLVLLVYDKSAYYSFTVSLLFRYNR